jgi:hypothetical protein
MVVAAGATPDWTTLAVAGPTEMAGAADGTRFEWAASVAVEGVPLFDGLPDLDFFPSDWTVDDSTMPFPAYCLS